MASARRERASVSLCPLPLWESPRFNEAEGRASTLTHSSLLISRPSPTRKSASAPPTCLKKPSSSPERPDGGRRAGGARDRLDHDLRGAALRELLGRRAHGGRRLRRLHAQRLARLAGLARDRRRLPRRRRGRHRERSRRAAAAARPERAHARDRLDRREHHDRERDPLRLRRQPARLRDPAAARLELRLPASRPAAGRERHHRGGGDDAAVPVPVAHHHRQGDARRRRQSDARRLQGHRPGPHGAARDRHRHGARRHRRHAGRARHLDRSAGRLPRDPLGVRRRRGRRARQRARRRGRRARDRACPRSCRCWCCRRPTRPWSGSWRSC